VSLRRSTGCKKTPASPAPPGQPSRPNASSARQQVADGQPSHTRDDRDGPNRAPTAFPRHNPQTCLSPSLTSLVRRLVSRPHPYSRAPRRRRPQGGRRPRQVRLQSRASRSPGERQSEGSRPLAPSARSPTSSAGARAPRPARRSPEIGPAAAHPSDPRPRIGRAAALRSPNPPPLAGAGRLGLEEAIKAAAERQQRRRSPPPPPPLCAVPQLTLPPPSNTTRPNTNPAAPRPRPRPAAPPPSRRASRPPRSPRCRRPWPPRPPPSRRRCAT
jgi:hypothetical protein